MKKCIHAIICILCCYSAFSQNISGIINNYAAVTSIAGTTINVTSSAGFNAGDKIIIIQMKGATITTTNTSNYGDIAGYNDAGNWEFATISATTATSITVAAALANTYTASAKVQIVSVPVYCSVNVIATLTCQPWNGATGGVLAFISGGSVTMNADIDISGTGFRPGTACSNGTFFCNNTNWFLNPSNCQAGWKGEGIAEYFNTAQSGGRAKLANGGGGANRANNGGGGGGNYGAGGLGGFEDASCGATGIQGIGGLALNYTLGKIFLGGGGGNGSGDDGGTIFPGTNGGGIAIIAANTIIPNGFSIKAEGLDQTGITNDEGGGGGGGGGTVCLDVQSILTPLNVSLNGGDGGSIDNILVPTGCQGPGGGGGGGTLWVSGAVLPANVIFTATGGAPGIMITAASSCFNTSDGATAGSDGNAIFNFPSQPLPTSLIPVSLGNDTAICPLGGYTLSTDSAFVSFIWQDGSTNATFLVSDSGFYSVTAADTTGCFSSDTVHIGFLPPYTFSIGNDTTLCAGDTVVLDAGPNGTAYLWQDSSTAQTFNAVLPGQYSVSVVDTDGCIGLSTIHVQNFGIPPLNIGNDTSICFGDKVIFNAGAFADYLWQDGWLGPFYNASDTGTYYVTVTDFNGCSQSDTAHILSFYQQPPDTFLKDTFLCEGQVILLLGPEGYDSYLWTDSSATSAITVLKPGVYGLTITNQFGCKSTDSALVAEKCPTNLYMPTAFTPNGDGINDTYMPIGYNITFFDMKIFNRYGQLVYATLDITKGWDGRYKGIKSEMGTYVYLVTWAGEQDGITSTGNLKGNLTLIR